MQTRESLAVKKVYIQLLFGGLESYSQRTARVIPIYALLVH